MKIDEVELNEYLTKNLKINVVYKFLSDYYSVGTDEFTFQLILAGKVISEKSIEVDK